MGKVSEQTNAHSLFLQQPSSRAWKYILDIVMMELSMCCHLLL